MVEIMITRAVLLVIRLVSVELCSCLCSTAVHETIPGITLLLHLLNALSCFSVICKRSCLPAVVFLAVECKVASYVQQSIIILKPFQDVYRKEEEFWYDPTYMARTTSATKSIVL